MESTSSTNSENVTTQFTWGEIPMGRLMFFSCMGLIFIVFLYLFFICFRRFMASKSTPDVVREIKKLRIRLRKENLNNQPLIIANEAETRDSKSDEVVLNLPV